MANSVLYEINNVRYPVSDSVKNTNFPISADSESQSNDDTCASNYKRNLLYHEIVRLFNKKRPRDTFSFSLLAPSAIILRCLRGFPQGKILSLSCNVLSIVSTVFNSIYLFKIFCGFELFGCKVLVLRFVLVLFLIGHMFYVFMCSWRLIIVGFFWVLCDLTWY